MNTTQDARQSSDLLRHPAVRKGLGAVVAVMGVFSIWMGVSERAFLAVAFGSLFVFAGVSLWTPLHQLWSTLFYTGLGLLEVDRGLTGSRWPLCHLIFGGFAIVWGIILAVREVVCWRTKRRELRTDNRQLKADN